MSEVAEKGCTGCDRWLPLHWFTRDRRQVDGRGTRCSDCRARDAEERSRIHEQARQEQIQRGIDGLARVTFEEAYGGVEAVAAVFEDAGFVQAGPKRWELRSSG